MNIDMTKIFTKEKTTEEQIIYYSLLCLKETNQDRKELLLNKIEELKKGVQDNE